MEGDATVSARDALANALWDNYTQAQKDAFIDAFAHELAEKQRKAIEDFDLDDHWAVFYRVSDVEGLPNLIDPSKSEP